MSEPAASEGDGDREPEGANADQAEVLDGVPVLVGPPRILPVRGSEDSLVVGRVPGTVLPAVQAAAVAAGGFVAGAAVVGLVHRRSQRRSRALAKGHRRGRALKRGGNAGKDGRAADLLQIVGSRSLLLDVHLLGGPGTDS